MFIDKSIEILQNTSKIWRDGDIESKIRIQNLVFPEGVSIRLKNREYLTKKVNQVFTLTSTITMDSEGVENEKTHQNSDGSFLVAGTGLEPVTFGL